VMAGLTASIDADWVDVYVVWMRSAGPGLVTVVTLLLVIVSSMVFIPISLLSVGLGYLWTYAYDVSDGIGLCGLVVSAGAVIASAFMYAVGATCCAHRFQSEPVTSAGGRMMELFHGVPFRLLVMLRLCPVMNFTFLSYYAGATDRFTFQQAVSTTVAFMPLAFMYVAVGGAILKFRLVARGEADDEQYLPAIWACFSVSAVGFLLMTLFVVLTFRKQKKKMGEGAELSKPTIKKNDSAWSDDGTGPQGAAVSMEDIDPEVGAPPPPALGTELSEATVEAGWREVVADDGDVYFFNDETGESQWDKPSTKPGEDFAE